MVNRREPATDRDPGLLRLLVLICCVVATAATLRWAVGSPVATLHPLVDRTGVEFDLLVRNSAGSAAWLGLGWLCLAASLELAGAVPGWCGRSSRAVARRVSPPLVRRIAQTLIGLSVLAGPISTGSAAGAVASGPPASGSGTSTAFASTPLDRPATAPNRPADLAIATPAPAGSIDLDRPTPPFLPTAPPPAPKLAPAGPAVLMSGAPHRSIPDDTYVVRRGDALWDIAARRLGPDATQSDVAREWPRWYAANRTVIGADPNLIRPGERLRPPAA
jgi:hypothetical protein